ncbi:hypothetical protein [Streptomyces virginiae]
MAKSDRRKKQQRHRSGAQVSGNPPVRRSASPKGRLGPFLKLLGEIAITAERTVLTTPNAADRLVRFDIEILMRGATA